MDINLEIKGLDSLARILNAQRIHAAMVSGMRKAMLYTLGKLPPYPPSPAGSTYRRTGALGRRNTSAVRDEGVVIEGIVGNNTEYAGYVIGRETQAWMHVGRWWTLESSVEAQAPTITEIITNEVGDALNRGT